MTHRVVAMNYTTLLINSTQQDDAGMYRCEIITDILPPETIFFNISVYNATDDIPPTKSMTTSSTSNTSGIYQGDCKNTYNMNKLL